jgi:hypothetical protein
MPQVPYYVNSFFMNFCKIIKMHFYDFVLRVKQQPTNSQGRMIRLPALALALSAPIVDMISWSLTSFSLEIAVLGRENTYIV